MSEQSQPQEVIEGEPPVEALPAPEVKIDTPIPEPIQEVAPEEPKLPEHPYPNRKYLKQGFSIMFGEPSVHINGTFFQANGNNIDSEGFWGDKPFYTTAELFNMAGYTNEVRAVFIGKMQYFLGQNNR